MGHVGFTPQSVNQLGGYRVQGRTEEAAAQILEDALALQEAGAFAIVLELMPTEVAATVTERLTVPTIGIGAGPRCDGQVQVFHDLLGLLPDFRPKHAGRYGDLAEVIDAALVSYADDVRGNKFPTTAESFSVGTGGSGSSSSEKG